MQLHTQSTNIIIFDIISNISASQMTDKISNANVGIVSTSREWMQDGVHSVSNEYMFYIN